MPTIESDTSGAACPTAMQSQQPSPQQVFNPVLSYDPHQLSGLPAAELVAIILKQQETLNALQNQGVTPAEVLAPPLAPPKSPYLLLRTEDGNCYFTLTDSSCWTIGRGDDNSIPLPDRWMSRNHAMIQAMAPNEFYLIDLGSRNGTFLNSRRVNVPVSLRHGDHITFGQTELEFFAQAPVSQPHEDSATLGLNLDHPPEKHEGSATVLLHVRRLLSVLVVDIRGFTVLARQLDEALLSEVMGTWFHQAGNIIRQYGSWVDKYIGDAVMAVWIHSSTEVSVQDMQRVLLALHDLHQMTSRLHLDYGLDKPIRVGAGLNTGYAMVGNTGSGDRPDYTALGDTVNAAFRLESATKELAVDVALGATTYGYLAGRDGDPKAISFRLQLANLKGYEAPVPIYTGTFGDLQQFLAMRIKRDDTLY
ncbi:adenylate/guanylate cyclase domain-containing protein [Thermosynechococcaceae cyanobacterium BACA0444]|uniref:Adenylate/guanylate cyclase domain-containing protein n=1 Tax=Pseudocalidococcus azoricus BACA0444 TaxID=2918990 RepID=A0AAE4JZE8_9CYAN|nr:adenylate/guanylate cyclase domain-containing protein [Pseudocalidococcus azoricus]MDS3862019.1 adenylate/guanylate cyclase domain-containing protein [Pseudocalidococcus azoricus BACA0444]